MELLMTIPGVKPEPQSGCHGKFGSPPHVRDGNKYFRIMSGMIILETVLWNT